MESSSPALIRRFLLNEPTTGPITTSSGSQRLHHRSSYPTLTRTTPTAALSLETATLTHECSSNTAWDLVCNRSIHDFSSLQGEEQVVSSTLATTVDHPEPEMPTSPNSPITVVAGPGTGYGSVSVIGNGTQLSAAQIMVSRIVENSKRRRSLGELMCIMSKKTRAYLPSPRSSIESQEDSRGITTAAVLSSAETKTLLSRKSISEAPLSPSSLHVSSLESFPRHSSSTSSLRIQYIKDFFRSGSSTTTTAVTAAPTTTVQARSTLAVDASNGRETRRLDGTTSSEYRLDHQRAFTDRVIKEEEDEEKQEEQEEKPSRALLRKERSSEFASLSSVGTAPRTPLHSVTKSNLSSRQNTLLTLLPTIHRNPSRLRITTPTDTPSPPSAQSSTPGTPLNNQWTTTYNTNFDHASLQSLSSKNNSNASSVCPSPVVVVGMPHCTVDNNNNNKSNLDSRDQDQALILQRPVYIPRKKNEGYNNNSSCTASVYSASSSSSSSSPPLLPSLTSVNAIWEDPFSPGNFPHDEGYPSQEPNNTHNNNVDNNTSATVSHNDNNNINVTYDSLSATETGRWPWTQLTKDKWNATFLSAHRGLLLLPPTYSPASEMEDPIAIYGRSHTIAIGGSSLEDGNCMNVRFGGGGAGVATSMESNSLAGSRISVNPYFDESLGLGLGQTSSYGGSYFGTQCSKKQPGYV
ncbi:hypothetical protein BGX28_008610 [Mortierella sp. GBA30]|nr:hypothetical protein BGX28_008610 [Mortierella sp. GBA30]